MNTKTDLEDEMINYETAEYSDASWHQAGQRRQRPFQRSSAFSPSCLTSPCLPAALAFAPLQTRQASEGA